MEERDKPVYGIVCRRSQAKRCAYCESPSDKLCDAPISKNGKAGTCDKPLCKRCARTIGLNQDLCPAHFRIWDKNRKGLML